MDIPQLSNSVWANNLQYWDAPSMIDDFGRPCPKVWPPEAMWSLQPGAQNAAQESDSVPQFMAFLISKNSTILITVGFWDGTDTFLIVPLVPFEQI